ncbi:hypothetical protein NQ314_010534 [Rhamnusium bicolor]|uniref:Uncharacterized protein n=1 Tax=Rhamnusium bicolor TaxID=1586634 RepID=A0AAV8XPQ2_9CUCU|nr:hypothetical protein NQ314_010534 [Rhamnusium bicolor]
MQVIPSQKEYAPPLCLKIHDSRRFGVYAYAGVHITSVSSFLTIPLTAEARAKKVSGLEYKSNESIASDSSMKLTFKTKYIIK